MRRITTHLIEGCDDIQTPEDLLGFIRNELDNAGIQAGLLLHDVATPEEVQRACSAYQQEGQVEIDDNAAASRTDNGLWVQAWVWLDSEERQP